MSKSDLKRLKDGLTDLVSGGQSEAQPATNVGDGQMTMPDGTVVTLDAKAKVKKTIERALSEIKNRKDAIKR